MAGIYIHVPFCRKKCHYCDFYKITQTGLIPSYIEALKKELHIRRTYTADETIESIYFGGGTPSLLNPGQIRSVTDAITREYDISPLCEVTLEANPDDINSDYVTGLKDNTIINRISLGIQSFFDDDLQFLNRRHNASGAFNSIEECLKQGYTNLSLDLIYGIPGLTAEKWIKNLDYSVSSGAVHISAYHLTVEPGTVLHQMILEGTISPVEDETGREQYETLCRYMTEAGFDHYEISNFCRVGYYAVHNTNYWRQKIYLGLGPAAHSFNITSRQWNLPGVGKYIHAVNEGTTAYGREDTDATRSYNEYIMLSLRTKWGVDPYFVEARYGKKTAWALSKTASEYLKSNQMIITEGRYVLTEEAWFVSDGIIKQFIIK